MLNRAYWRVENRMHWVRDVALRENASCLLMGALLRAWAAFTSPVIPILRLLQVAGIKRRMNQSPLRLNSAFQLLRG